MNYFNPDLNKQATELLFSCKKYSPNHPSLFFNDSVVSKLKEQKHLGLQLESNLSSFFNAFLSRDHDNPRRVRSTAWTGQTFTTHTTLDTEQNQLSIKVSPDN